MLKNGLCLHATLVVCRTPHGCMPSLTPNSKCAEGAIEP